MTKKANWLFALLFTFCALTTRAQVFSSNGVGYVNVTLHPGFNLVANPLIAHDNSIGALFYNIQGGVPAGLKIFRMVGDRFETIVWNDLDDNFIPEAAAAEETLPGDGVLVFLPGTQNRVLTFVGEIPQGDLCTTIPTGWSIKSSVVPQAINPADYNFPNANLIFRLTITGSYEVFRFDDLENAWKPSLPNFKVGEAFFVFNRGPAVDWCRTFFLNQPF